MKKTLIKDLNRETCSGFEASFWKPEFQQSYTLPL